MNNSPLKCYLFNYRFDGRNYAFDIMAESKEEAEARVRAIGANAALIGEDVVRVGMAGAPSSEPFPPIYGDGGASEIIPRPVEGVVAG